MMNHLIDVDKAFSLFIQQEWEINITNSKVIHNASSSDEVIAFPVHSSGSSNGKTSYNSFLLNAISTNSYFNPFKSLWLLKLYHHYPST